MNPSTDKAPSMPSSRPWVIVRHDGHNDGCVAKDIAPLFIEQPDGYRLAYIIGDVEQINPDANAALIIQAVNEYEAFAALERAIIEVGHRAEINKANCKCPICMALKDLAAIRKATQ